MTTRIKKCKNFDNDDCTYHEVKIIQKKNDIDFVMGQQVGKGGVGSIYNTRNSKKIREPLYVLKLIDIFPLKDKDKIIRKFMNEIQIQSIAAKTGYSDPVELVFMDESNNKLGFVMKRYKVALSDYLYDSNIELIDKQKVLKKVKEAIIGISDIGIIHNDLFFTNIMLDYENNVKIIDFGRSELTDNIEEARESNLSEYEYIINNEFFWLNE